MIDLEEIWAKWLRVCGACDAGIGECNHPAEDYRPVMMDLVLDVERLRRQVDETQRFLGFAINDAWILEGAVDGARLSRNQMEQVFNDMVLREGLATSDAVRAESEVQRLRDVLDTIHGLHTDSIAGVCPSCARLNDVSDTDDGLVDWPCPTILAIDPGGDERHRCPDCGDEGWIHIGGPDSVRCETCIADHGWQVGDVTYGGIVTKDQAAATLGVADA